MHGTIFHAGKPDDDDVLVNELEYLWYALPFFW